MRRQFKLLAGSAILVACCLGLLLAVRSGRASLLYFRAKYRTIPGASVTGVLSLCEKAHRLNPKNFHNALWAADVAWNNRYEGGETNWVRRLDDAYLWTERGLAQNVHSMRLRQMKARLLAIYEPAQAVAYWRTYLDWAYWNPEHHMVLLDLCIDTGDLEGALEARRMLRGTEFEGAAVRKIRDAWQHEKDKAFRQQQTK